MIDKYIKNVLCSAESQAKLVVEDLFLNKKTITIFILIFLISVGGSSFFISLALKIGIFEFTSSFKTSTSNNILFISILVFSLRKVFYKKLYLGNLTFTIPGLVLPILFSIGYFVFYRKLLSLNGSIDIQYWRIYYADIFCITISLICIHFKPFKLLAPKETKFHLYEDYFDIQSEIDKLKRENIAQNIAEVINNTTTKNSFAISILGEWGMGKTTFIKFIIKKLKENSSENVIVEFNPWKPSKTDDIVKEFFSLVITEVDKFDSDLKSKLVYYSKELTGKLNPFSDFLFSLLGLFDRQINLSLEKSSDEINESIKKSGKRFIVFIDDLDRLNGAEVIEVIRIIRNNANFSNFFFISGFDYDYIKQVLSKTETIALEHNYIKKIFQLEFILPQISHKEIIEVLDNILQNDEQLFNRRDEIKEIFNTLNSYSYSLKIQEANKKINNKQLVESPREIVRIVNSLKIALKLTEQYIVLKDLIILEIIKNKFIEVYLELAKSDRIFQTSNHTQFGQSNISVNDEIITEISNNVPYLKEYSDLIMKLLNLTSWGKDNIEMSINSLLYQSNKGSYFRYLTEGLIGNSEMNVFWESELTHQISLIEKWRKEERTKNMLSFLMKKDDYTNWKDFCDYIKLFTYISQVDGMLMHEVITRIKNYVYNAREPEISTYISEYIINEILGDESILAITRSNLTYCLIEMIIKNPNASFNEKLNKKTLQNFNLELLRVNINSANRINDNSIILYKNNLERLTENKIIITKEANKIFKEFINKNKTDYIINVLRPYYLPRDENYVFDSFISQIFETEEGNGFEEFEKFLLNYDEDRQLKEFITKHFNASKNVSFNPIKLDEGEIIYLNGIQKRIQ